MRPIAIGAMLLAGTGTAMAQSAPRETAAFPQLAVTGAYGHIDTLVRSLIMSEPNKENVAQRSSCSPVPPLRTETAQILVERIAAEEQFDPEFARSVAKIESHYVSTALSNKGAYGLMQLMPETARRFKVDLCDPSDNIRGGIHYLRVLQDRYRNPFFVLAAYNAGEEAVQKSRGVPPFPETVRFIADVMNDFYAWPAPASEKPSTFHSEAAGSAGVLEISKTQAQPEDKTKSGLPASWSAGFVMHIE